MPTLLLQQVPAAPAPPAPPAPGAAATPAPAVAGATTGQGTIAIPMTRREIEALKQRRAEISNQLESASGRREELAEKLPGMDGAARAGIQDRIALLDKRILALESQLDQTGQQLALASPAVLAAATAPASPLDRIDSDAMTGITVTFTLFVLTPLAIAFSRLMWKRAVVPPRQPALSGEAAGRLDRIENAVDAIAIEVERVSEGQRFLTRLFTEGRDPAGANALGAGERAAEPIKVGRQDAVGVPRNGT